MGSLGGSEEGGALRWEKLTKTSTNTLSCGKCLAGLEEEGIRLCIGLFNKAVVFWQTTK